jgi:type I restriction enzyme R subunit
VSEAKARIKINQLLSEAGWRFFDTEEGKANIILENNVQITKHHLNDLGEDFEKSAQGYIDFLLLDNNGYPFIVLEAKSEEKNPLFGKEQARKYAVSQNCRFIILSNGNQHFFWDLQLGDPHIITRFPTPESVGKFTDFKPNPNSLTHESVARDYIAITQRPDYARDPSYVNEQTRPQFVETNHLSFLRPYQLQAVKSIQAAIKEGKNRFLLEMATGTGKTLVAAALIKMFLRSGSVHRVLFLVDRLELEDQAKKNFVKYLRQDFKCVIYKENRNDWRKAEIVVSTVQTMLASNRYKRLFSPGDFQLIISDEAHRSINGNSRSVFEYFIGYKLGLTATPKDYLKNIDPDKINQNDPRELERRMLLDTYKTFGCENGIPTFRYSLIDGVRDGFLINPIVVDARTDISTELLSEKGYSVLMTSDEGEEAEQAFVPKDFEHRFFSENTNRVFCNAFLQNALIDPVSKEFGKSIIFCVSQNHAAKITQMLNEEATRLFPGKYQSDFALQVTSSVMDSQHMSIRFSNNNLSGYANFLPMYRTSKTRVCVTVGMMTTGYDCEDILNLCLMRPIFSPTEFIQIKGRGTRTYNFSRDLLDPADKKQIGDQYKHNFKLFDFFANCEYFEEKFNYDEVLKLPKYAESPTRIELTPLPVYDHEFESVIPDAIRTIADKTVGVEGMRIDRMYFEKFEERIKRDPVVEQKLQTGNWPDLESYIEKNHFNLPREFFDREKLRKALHIDRRITTRELVELIFGQVPFIKSKNELLDEEFDKFDSRFLPDKKYFQDARTVFKAYITDSEFRQLIDSGQFAMLNINPNGTSFRNIPSTLRHKIPEYIKDYVPLNQFME